MTTSRHRIRVAALAAIPVLLTASAALAQQRSGGLLDNLFSRGQPAQVQPVQQQQPQQQQPQQLPQGQYGAGGGSDVEARIDRIESALRQLTGEVQVLQHQNQLLQTQLQRMQNDTEYRFQQLGARGGAPTASGGQSATQPGIGNASAIGNTPVGGNTPIGGNTPVAGNTPPAPQGDAFNPALHPNAPGVPRSLGTEAPGGQPGLSGQAQVGAAGAPLDLNSLAGNPLPSSNGGYMAANPPNGQLPPPPPRNTSAPGNQLTTLPPSNTPQDEYDLAYGYVLRHDYALAAQTFRNFLNKYKYPQQKRVPEAQFWLGESLYQQRRYRDAAESFLAVSTKYEHSAKAPEALLRLGQSLAALHKKEAACATLAEVGRKYPRASPSVKRTVARELKRVHC